MKFSKQNVFFSIVILILIGLIINELLPKKDIVVKDNVQSAQTIAPGGADEVPQVKKADKIIIANFHATQRCASCTALGRLSEKTVTEQFTNEIASGKMEFKSINVDLPENEEMMNLYQASGSSLYINAIKDGKDNIVKNMKVWQYLSDDQAFVNYLETQLKTLL